MMMPTKLAFTRNSQVFSALLAALNLWTNSHHSKLKNEEIVNCNIVCTYKNRNKGNEKARSGKGRSCLSHTSYHAQIKPLFYCMSGLCVSIRGIIISCDIGVVKDKRIKQRG